MLDAPQDEEVTALDAISRLALEQPLCTALPAAGLTELTAQGEVTPIQKAQRTAASRSSASRCSRYARSRPSRNCCSWPSMKAAVASISNSPASSDPDRSAVSPS